MKKSLLVLALFGAAGIAQAASVTLYGRIDAGFKYNYDKKANAEAVKGFTMENGLKAGSRVGVKGVEQIGDLKVGFQLENRFNIANGDANGMKKGGTKLFDGQARVYVAGDFGSVHVGRFGGLGGDAAMDVVFGQYALGSGAADHGFAGLTTGKFDASVEYKSPVFSGVQLHAMYANTNEVAPNKDRPNVKRKGYLDLDNKHYFGIAADYNANGLGLVAAYEQTKADAKADKVEFFNVAGSYDFEVVKAFAGYQYDKADGEKLNAFTLGLTAPVAGGELAAQASYGVDKADGAKDKKSELAVRYAYNLSKRTEVFAGVGFGQEKLAGGDKNKSGNVYFGLGHNF